MGYVTGGFGRKNPRWQAYYDSRWYVYAIGYDGRKRKYTRQGAVNAKPLAKELSYAADVNYVVVFPSKRTQAKVGKVKYHFSRANGWKTLPIDPA